VAIPAALVNAGLKYCQKLIQLAFMRRLTHHLHNHYTSNRAYFAASTLRGTITVISPASTPLHPTLLAEAVLSLLRDISRVPFYYVTLVVAPELGAIDVTPPYASCSLALTPFLARCRRFTLSYGHVSCSFELEF